MGREGHIWDQYVSLAVIFYFILRALTILIADNQGTAIFSGRREGLALYLSRLVRPLWKSKLTSPG